MSLDNVLAVAGAAHGHLWILVFGLALPVGLGIAWLIFLRLFAKTFTYLLVISIGVLLTLLTLATLESSRSLCSLKSTELLGSSQVTKTSVFLRKIKDFHEF